MNNGKITVASNKVNAVQTVVNWNNTPWITVEVRKQTDGRFASHISTPEGGGMLVIGKLSEALEELDSDVASKYEKLFQLENPSEESLSEIGFSHYEVTR
jgi:hypothetical protein